MPNPYQVEHDVLIDATPPVVPGEDGRYPVATPGVTKVF